MADQPISLDILRRAVQAEDKATIRYLLRTMNSDLKEVDESGNTLLHLLLRNQRLTEEELADVVQIFLSRDVNPNSKNYSGETVLSLSVKRKSIHVIDVLIKYNVEVDKIAHYFIEDEYEKFENRLEHGNDDFNFWNNDDAEKASVRFAELLIERKFCFDAKNEWGNSALKLAMTHNLLHILPALLKETNDFTYFRGDSRNLFPLLVTETLLPKLYYDRYIFRIVDILLDRGLIVTIECEKDFRYVEILIKQVQKNGDGGNYALSLFHGILQSCNYWKESTVRYYVTALKSLIAKGINVNEANKHGKTPLYWAVAGRNLHALDLLEISGADFHVKDETGSNLLKPLIQISNNQQLREQQVFEFLIMKGCDVNEEDNHGTRLLHFAAQRTDEHSESQINIALRLLLKHGAYVNVRDNNEDTALWHAVTNLRSVNVQDLLEWGADVNDECIVNFRPDNDQTISLYRILVEHWIKLKAADFPCSSNFEIHTRNEESQSFFERCLKELTILKNTFINDRITLYDWIATDLNLQLVYLKNQKLKNSIDSPTLKEEFPLYSTVILASYREASARKTLLKPAIASWLTLTEIDLPSLCIERVLAHLSNVDLLTIIEYNRDDANLKKNLARLI